MFNKEKTVFLPIFILFISKCVCQMLVSETHLFGYYKQKTAPPSHVLPFCLEYIKKRNFWLSHCKKKTKTGFLPISLLFASKACVNCLFKKPICSFSISKKHLPPLHVLPFFFDYKQKKSFFPNKLLVF